MSNLFSTQASKAGFRLQYVQLINWGTFQNDVVFKIEPKGNNSLLTGANASGKSTFVDALLTLLVPFKKDRFYNQSSGVDKKGDRTEETYVLGNYGKTQKDGKMQSQTLRDNSTFSVILASFSTAFSDTEQKTVTLFQVRWFSNGILKRSFGICHEPLTIETDFLPFDSQGNWKKRLEKKYNTNATRKKIELFSDKISSYRTRLIGLFGMQSEKALILFNQIVGVKVLEDLDVFIRTTMLEEKNAEEKFIDLKENFNTLLKAKTDIEKAIEQITQLNPINELALQLEKNTLEFEQITKDKEVAHYWFANKSVELGQKELTKITQTLEELKAELEKLNAEEDELKDEERKLSIAIEKDEVGNTIKELEKEIKDIEKESNKRMVKLDIYNDLAKDINITQNPTQQQFLDSFEVISLKKEQNQTQIDTENEKLRNAETKQKQVEENIQETITIIQTLQKNKNNISGRVAQIREEIINHLGLTKEEIPFIGELIRVKEEEQKWEASIEKILHGFALRLIIPKNHLYAVNQFVNPQNLKGKIVYESYDDSFLGFGNGNNNLSQNSLVHKLEFKQNSSKNKYKEWLENAIFGQFNFECLDKIETFNTYKGKAVTENGLIKYKNERYQKDDRPDVALRSNYVLGWDNVEKIRFYQKELKAFQAEQISILAEKKSLIEILKLLNSIKENAARLTNEYKNYEEIDWEICVKQIDQKKNLKIELETTNDKVKKLNEQLKLVEAKLKKLTKTTIHNKGREIFQAETSQKHIEKQVFDNQIILDSTQKVDNLDFEKVYNLFVSQIDFETLPSKQKEFQGFVNEKSNKLDKEITKVKFSLRERIIDFKKPKDEITNKFKDWRADVERLPDAQNLDLVSEYQYFLKKLNEEDLPSHQKRFNDYLNTNMISNVQNFKSFFTKWKEIIEERMYQLNKSLQEIDYESIIGYETYIRLAITKRKDENINDFEKLLAESLPNIVFLNEVENGREIHFEKYIRPLIQKLDNEEWRKKVMDVRAWMSYKAEEIYRKDEQKGRVYEGMGELSGGEKAQLTYTILGAAVSSQFGLTKEGTQSNSFRFIAIDEAFKAQDEDKARYLVRLCKQLHLQFLVVTPSDNIDIVANDISFVHYVERKEKKHSYLYDMPIEQYKLQKEQDRILKELEN